MSVDRARDRPVSPASLVLVDHCRALAVVTHPGHQVLDADPGGGGEGVPGVAQIMEVRAVQTGGPRRPWPARHPVEVAALQWRTLGPENTSELGLRATKTAVGHLAAGASASSSRQDWQRRRAIVTVGLNV